jgi:hypothetical protein
MTSFEIARNLAHTMICQARETNGGTLLSVHIPQAVDQVLPLVASTEVDREELIAELQRSFAVWIGEERTITDDDGNWEPWLDKRKADIHWRYWSRYRQYLLQQGWADAVVSSVDASTDRTLGLLNNPGQSGWWDRRGMVVGHVQSGKTANYAGLICKAADAGYRTIIVLAGFHNNLRTQTQIRLEESFLGYDRSRGEQDQGFRPVGVGRIFPVQPIPNTVTTRTGDFNRQVAQNFAVNLQGNAPILFVIKKNASVLRNLINYLEWAAQDSRDENGRPIINNSPLLLIDDEADQGSVDTRRMDVENGVPDQEHDPTTLNRRIRRILMLFSQSAYIGYTATPFANIFIHSEAMTNNLGDDLFPRSFITVIPTPEEYVGPVRVFGLVSDNPDDEDNRGLPITRSIDSMTDSDGFNEAFGWMPPRHRVDHIPLVNGENRLPDSLMNAIYAFILGCAIRLARGQGNQHSSMLIHVTRFTQVQMRVTGQINQTLIDIQNEFRYGGRGDSNQLANEIFYPLWEKDFIVTAEEIDDPDCLDVAWDAVRTHLSSAAQSIQVREVNGRAGDILDYETYRDTGLNVIAIGGDKLSRGLTLEGLIVSYFMRASRMYDTLMQMGRWFGYRKGFLDICRLYAPDELIEWFGHIADASEELRREFRYMYEIGATPKTYGQRVRSHPVLLVTSQVKMRHATELTLTYDGVLSQTIVFSRDREAMQNNYDALFLMIRKVSEYGQYFMRQLRATSDDPIAGKHFWTNVSAEDVLNFIDSYKTTNHARRVDCTRISDYIRAQNDRDMLTNWSVLISGIQSGKLFDLAGFATGMVERGDKESGNIYTAPYRTGVLTSPKDENWDLTNTQYREALRKTINGSDKENISHPGGPEIRGERPPERGLLIVYPLNPHRKTIGGDPEIPFVGFALSFPGDRYATRITYTVANNYDEQHYE